VPRETKFGRVDGDLRRVRGHHVGRCDVLHQQPHRRALHAHGEEAD
jgi:hypothetical protein